VSAPDLTEARTRTAILEPEPEHYSAASYSTLSSGACRIPEPMPASEPESQIVADQWRDEVASRVNSYRRRRGRKEDEHTMRLDFEAPAPTLAQTVIAHVVAERSVDPDVSCDINYFRRTNAAPTPVYELEEETYSPDPDFDPENTVEEDFLMESAIPANDPDFDFNAPRFVSPAEEPAPTPEQISLDEARWGFAPEETLQISESGNVIVFPMQPTYQSRVVAYELAEPVLERPRILDVPEEAMPMASIYGPLFANINLDFEKDEPVRSDSRPDIDIPLQVAMINQRVFGGIVDAGVVLSGFAAFAAVFYKMSSTVEFTKPVMLAAVAIPAIFWMVYQYVFLTYAGQTPGMMLAHMTLVNFEGGRPDQRRRRLRAVSMIVSLISGGVGFGWALLDPDALCWHDSISRTYVTQDR
jgi:uncharacterized RDD family membrane protein YckC